LVGSIYFRLGLDSTGQQDRMGVLFFLTMNTAFSNLGSLAMFLFDRSIYVREHRNGMYRPSAYYLGKILQDVPLGIMVNFVFSTIAYFMVGLQGTAEKFFMFFLICTLVMLNSYTLCLFISNIAKNYQVANVIAPLVLVLYLLPSGFLINLNSIPIIWRWIKYISFFRYGFEALVLNEFEGLTFDCTNCTKNGLDYVELTYGFRRGDFDTSVYITGGSCVVYAVLGYICLRLFRTGEGK
jgi:ATP-binding cassette, subfamily G (WHITE), member 2